MRLVIGITGSTGVIYGIRMLEVLKKLNIETHLIMSEWAEKCISMETDHDVEYVKSLAVTISNENNMAASVSSGTHKTDGMIVIPCSMKTLSSIANGYDETSGCKICWCYIKRITETNFGSKRNTTHCYQFRKYVKTCKTWSYYFTTSYRVLH